MARSRKRRKQLTGKQKLYIGGIIGLAVVLILLLSGYGIFRRYYDMMHREGEEPEITTSAEAENGSQEAMEAASDPEEETESLAEGETNSPQEEIDQMNKDLEGAEAEKVRTDKNVTNILLIGTDARTKSERGRSDSMILVSINKSSKKVVMTSIMRDVYVKIAGHGGNRVNAAYSFGGTKLLVSTLENYLGIKIDHTARVNFSAFEDVVDVMGGVTLYVTAEEIKALNGYAVTEPDLPIKSGTTKMNGALTLAYCRIRYLKGSDFGRTERQRKVLDYLMGQAKKMSASKLDKVLSAALPKVTTDMSEKDVLSLMSQAPAILGYSRVSFRIPIDGSYKGLKISGRDVLSIEWSKNRSALQKEIYGN